MLEKEIAALGIAMEAIGGVRNMTEVLKIAKTKEDFIFVLKTMITELEQSEKQIDELIDN